MLHHNFGVYLQFIYMQQIRATILSETELQASKARFALFSQPPPLAVGDNSAFLPKIHPRGQNGKPISQPRNIFTTPSKSGKLKGSLFSLPQSIYVGDPYRHSRSVSYLNKLHDSQWLPASLHPKHEYYKYMEQPPPEKKVIKDENGRLVIEPRNVHTNSCSKIQRTLLKGPKYIEDPYQGKEILDKEIEKRNREKRGDESFSPGGIPSRLFMKDSLIYGTDVKFPEKRSCQPKLNIYHHESSFKPTNINRGPFNKFPEYKPESPPRKPRIFDQPNPQKKEPFILNKASLSRPTPSVSLNPTNLRRSMK